MRILHVINRLSISNGAAKLMLDLAFAQKEVGNVVDVATLTSVTPSYEQDVLEHDCSFYPLSDERGSRFNPLLLFRLKRLMRNYDIVHVHLFPSLYWVALAKFCFGLSCKLVVTEHSILNHRMGKSWLKPLEHFMYGRYDRIIAISNPVASALRSHVDYNDRIVVIENGTNLNRFAQAMAISKKELTVPENAILITQVARFMYEKDQKTLLRALSLLPSQYHVVFVGDGGLMDEHKSFAKYLGVDSRTHFLGMRRDVPAILKASDIVVMSSNFEGFGLVAIEGMAAGKPVIASDVPGLAEVVRDAGLLFKVHDEKGLAKLIKKLAENEIFYEEIRGRCKKRAEQYSVENMISKYDALYKSM